jgi:hypothetical protein
MRKLPKGVAAFFLAVILPGPLAAGEGIALATELSLQASSRPEIKAALTQSFVFPFLQGEGPLTAGNNLTAALRAELSPLSLNGIAGLTWTPIAFFQVIAGGRLGSGWNIALGNGIGINSPLPPSAGETARKSDIKGDPFGGLYWGIYGGAVIQFDLGALFPGDWNHVVFRTTHEGRYRAYSGAGPGPDANAWVFEGDAGENRNGFSYHGSYLLGYQMPASPVFTMVGFLAEMDRCLYGEEGGKDWGDDLPFWYFGILFNLRLGERLGLTLAVQTRTLRNHGTSDLENRERYYFKDLLVDRSDPYRLLFYRAAAVCTYKLF